MEWYDEHDNNGNSAPIECGCGKSFWASLVEQYCSWDEFDDNNGTIVHHIDIKCPYCNDWMDYK